MKAQILHIQAPVIIDKKVATSVQFIERGVKSKTSRLKYNSIKPPLSEEDKLIYDAFAGLVDVLAGE